MDSCHLFTGPHKITHDNKMKTLKYKIKLCAIVQLAFSIVN